MHTRMIKPKKLAVSQNKLGWERNVRQRSRRESVEIQFMEEKHVRACTGAHQHRAVEVPDLP
jgi:hypothetical protein